MRKARDPITLLLGVPAERLGRHRNPLSLVRHAKLIQGSDAADTLWKTIRWHEAVMTALQRHL